MQDYYVLVLFILFLILLGIILYITIYFESSEPSENLESEEKRVGRQGEEFASRVIREILNEKDTLLTNVKISFEEKDTELDNVIINNRGVFIIEVKNYRGVLAGNEDDYEWRKTKYTSAGNVYSKSVRNPIRQVKRQVYILAAFLKQYGIEIWVEGYVYLVRGESPVKSKYILNTSKEIKSAIHFGTNNKLTKSTKEKIVELLL